MEVVAVDLEYDAVLGPQEVDDVAGDPDLRLRFRESRFADQLEAPALRGRVGDRRIATPRHQRPEHRGPAVPIGAAQDVTDLRARDNLADHERLVERPLQGAPVQAAGEVEERSRW